MSKTKALTVTINKINGVVSTNDVKPLITFLRKSARSGSIPSEDLNEILESLDLSSDQLENICEFVSEFIIELSGEVTIESEPDMYDPLDDEFAARQMELDEDEADSDETEDPLSFGQPDPVKLYIEEIKQYKRLTPEEEKMHAKNIFVGNKAKAVLEKEEQSGVPLPIEKHVKLKHAVALGEKSKDQMIKSNLALVVFLAKGYSNWGAPMLDLIQEGNIGLMRAVEGFDYRRGFKFSTYASMWIKQNIKRGITSSTRTIRLPANVADMLNRINKFIRDYTQMYGEEPDTDVIAHELNISEEKVINLLRVSEDPTSLDTPVKAKYGIDGATVGHFVRDPNAVDPERLAETIALRESLSKELSRLTVREDVVIRLRFSIEDDQYHTLEEIGNEFTMTRERVRQIETRALQKLRRPSAKEQLKVFLPS